MDTPDNRTRAPDNPQLRLARDDYPVIRWPDNARIAFWVAPNIEFYELYPPSNPVRSAWPRPLPDVLNYSWRDYGNRVGAWRCLEAFDEFKIVSSVSLNSKMCSHLPEVVEAFSSRGWELFCHGQYNTRYLFGLEPESELETLKSACSQISRFSGQPVRGFLAPALTYTASTFDNVSRAGMTYVLDLFNSDVPRPLRTDLGRMVSVPYQVELNDFHVLVQGGASPSRYVSLFKAHFERLYQEGVESGKVVGLPLHPYVIGSPHYIGALREILAYVKSFPHVWHARAGEIADWYLQHCYDAAIANCVRRAGSIR